jgi:hypothetical protein
MRNTCLLAAVAAGALVVAGCSALFITKYQICAPDRPQGTSVRVPGVDEGDLHAVREILASIAADLGYVEVKDSSSPGIFACFEQPLERFPILLTARTEGQTIGVCVRLFTPGAGGGRGRGYRAVRDRVQHDLERHFGSRVRRVPRN